MHSYGLCVVMMCLCGFINYNTHTALVGDADNGGGSACVGQEVCGKSLYLLLTSAVNLKLLQKIKPFFKNQHI